MRCGFIPAISSAALRSLLRRSPYGSPSRTPFFRGMRSLGSSSPPARAFQLRINPLTGDSEWIVVEEGAADEDIEPGGKAPRGMETPKSLLANTSYLDMLNDARRNRAFREAIEKTITRPCHVLDIGAGTGLLSMISARAMSRFGSGAEGSVSACESYLPMGKCLRRVLRANGMEKKVKVFHKRSDELHVGVDLQSPADVLVSEILDSELLGEGLIPTLQHAHDMLLVKNPQTVPYRAITYGLIVQSPFLQKLHDLHSSEVNLMDGIHLMPAGLEKVLGVKPQQYAMHCDAFVKEMKMLSEPFKIFEFNFWKRPESNGEIEIQIKATTDGQINAVVSWWVLQLDSDGSVFYSTAPKWIDHHHAGMVESCIPAESRDEGWCNHWKQCLWFIPGSGMPVMKDKSIFLKAFHDETKVSYCFKCDGDLDNNHSNLGDCLLMLTPEKIAVYGDKDWRLALKNTMRNVLNDRSSPLCIIADDSVFLTIVAASLCKDADIISSFPGLREKAAQYLKAVASFNQISMDQIKVFGNRASFLIEDDLVKRKVDLFVAEPFYYGYEGMLPWQNLRFWKERTSLDSVLSEDVVIIPSKGILRVCAMSLPDLWISHCCLKEIEGFDHSVANDVLGACGGLPEMQEGPCLPYYIWQCGKVEALSEAFEVMDFDFSKKIEACSGKTKISFSKPGVCHGFALWIDWVIDERNSTVISTGPDSRCWKQGVKLLNKPVVVNQSECYVEIEAQFDPVSGDLITESTFSAS